MKQPFWNLNEGHKPPCILAQKGQFWLSQGVVDSPQGVQPTTFSQRIYGRQLGFQRLGGGNHDFHGASSRYFLEVPPADPWRWLDDWTVVGFNSKIFWNFALCTPKIWGRCHPDFWRTYFSNLGWFNHQLYRWVFFSGKKLPSLNPRVCLGPIGSMGLVYDILTYYMNGWFVMVNVGNIKYTSPMDPMGFKGDGAFFLRSGVSKTPNYEEWWFVAQTPRVSKAHGFEFDPLCCVCVCVFFRVARGNWRRWLGSLLLETQRG